MSLSHITYERAKRGFDVALAGSALMVGSPLLAGIATLLKIEGTTPVLFRQHRVGKNERPFTIYKFRTLRDSDSNRQTHRLRATTVGRWLRRYGLDELPQLWNILKGDMSVIGPRPTIPSQVDRYSDFERRRLHVRPGITGWAQVHGRNALTWPERIQLDVWYVENRSWLLDLKILARTPSTVFSGRGVYGPEGENLDYSASAHE